MKIECNKLHDAYGKSMDAGRGAIATRDARIKGLEDSAAVLVQKNEEAVRHWSGVTKMYESAIARANAAEHDVEVWKARAEAERERCLWWIRARGTFAPGECEEAIRAGTAVPL